MVAAGSDDCKEDESSADKADGGEAGDHQDLGQSQLLLRVIQ